MLCALPKVGETYNYLTKMAMDSVTEEKAGELQAEPDVMQAKVIYQSAQRQC